MHIRIANDNAPMAVIKAPRRALRKRQNLRSHFAMSSLRRSRRSRRFSFDPLLVIPLCCTLALAVNAMLA